MRAYLIKQKICYLGNAIFLAEKCYRGYPWYIHCGYPQSIHGYFVQNEEKSSRKNLRGYINNYINNYFIAKHMHKRTKIKIPQPLFM